LAPITLCEIGLNPDSTLMTAMISRGSMRSSFPDA
jgi:hypothetical protein